MRKNGTYHPAPYQFVYLRVHIADLSFQPLVLTADTTVDPADHVIQEGVLSDVPIRRLEKGEERELEAPLCFVACGRFRVQVEARAVDGAVREARVGSATLKVFVSERQSTVIVHSVHVHLIYFDNRGHWGLAI